MTVTATLSQDGKNVDLPIRGPSGNPLIAVDHGKPNLNEHDRGGSPFKRIQDQWSGNQAFNLSGYYRGSNAYQNAIDLAELIQQDGGGDSITLDIPGIDEIESNISVAPAAEQAQAVTISYIPGRKNYVEIEANFTRVSETQASYSRTPTTPTATGNGPIQLTDGATTVNLEKDVTVTRSVGRPNDVIRRTPSQYPTYTIKRKIVADTFEISLAYLDDAPNKTQEIANLFSQRLGRNGLTLDFNGIYGLGELTVAPTGTQALRHVRQSGRGNTTIIPQITVDRITA